MSNLLGNAIKYSPHGGTIVVSVARVAATDGPWIGVEVSDEGVGIPAADLPRIFEPYYRASNVAGSIPGNGIGLAGVRSVVQSHGGTVTLSSTEGLGTTVTLRLPLQPEDSTPGGPTG